MRGYAVGLASLALSAGSVVAAHAGAHYPAAPPPIDSPVYSTTPFISADVSLFLGWAKPENADGQGFGGARGRVNFPLWWGLNEELEIVGAVGFDDGSTLGVFSHTYHKNEQFAYGVLLGAQGFGNGDTSHSFTAGVEGAVFLPQSTVLGLVSYTWPEFGDDFWTIGGEGRYYFTPNDELFALARYNTESPHWLLAAGYEHMFAGTSISAGISAGWKGGSLSEHFVMVDVTHYFGAASLEVARADRLFNESRLAGISLGGSSVSISDVRLKHSVVSVGRLENGIGLYRYQYLWSDQVYVGVMAQEVAQTMPEAVVQGADGYLRVDYGKLGLSLMTWEQWALLTGQPSS